MTLEPITVFATLNPIASFDYPGQVEVINRERHRRIAGIERLNDLFAQGSRAPWSMAARAAPARRRPSAAFPRRTLLVLLDGVRQGFVSGHDGRLFIEPELLKQVEVVKGPISSLYGSGALGGVIALTTVDAKDFLDPGETAGVKVKGGSPDRGRRIHHHHHRLHPQP